MNNPADTEPDAADPSTRQIARWITEHLPWSVSFPDIKAVLDARAALLDVPAADPASGDNEDGDQ